MNLHQVLTGAVNPGDNCFSVGSLNNVPFTAYASGCDIVILGSDFERLQIIPGAKHGNIQVGCVDCSPQSGQIAASYGNLVCVFEPVPLQNPESTQTFSYQWQKSGQFTLETSAHNLAWNPTGLQLLTGSSSLQLWASEGSTKGTQEAQEEASNSQDQSTWRSIWQCRTASPIHFLKFSPGGEFFATAGQDDCLVKVWYGTSSWKWDAGKLFTPPEQSSLGGLNFSFIYLAHPRSVTGFSWRKTSKYMPRGAVCNVLLTCCKDSVCRLWAETLLPSDSLLSGLKHNNNNRGNLQSYGDLSRLARDGRRVPSNGRAPNLLSTNGRSPHPLELNLHESWGGSQRGVLAHTSLLPQQQGTHYSHKPSQPHANALCHFHIAASINPATDIPLLPSISSLNGTDEEEPGGPFTVHWLHNKELQFTLAMEVLLQMLRTAQENTTTESLEREDDSDGCGPQSPPLSPPVTEQQALDVAAIEQQVELLLEDWNRSADMLFSIHPTDGSLLVWHTDWLDEYQPGMFRQAQVSFVSRIPVAFPTGDANSLGRSVVMYACNKNVDLAIQQGRQQQQNQQNQQQQQQRSYADGLTRSSSLLSFYGQGKPSGSSAASSSSASGGLRLSIFTPSVLMISKHADGSLNQWTVSFAEDSAFSTVLSVSHRSRYCGHRFHLNHLACHSLLPLLLTTSHHNALKPHHQRANGGAATAAVLGAVTSPAHHNHHAGGSPARHQGRSSLGAPPQDPNAVYSELILWRVEPVGPLSFSGGVSELARINSLHASAFANVAWLPALIPSNCLGQYGSSPSACFVANDGHSLRLYQAVIEAKKLLSEVSNPENSKSVGEAFNIISQQSTARPGCIIELDVITDFQGKQTQLLHVFEEDLIRGDQRSPDEEPQEGTPTDSACGQPVFSARFFLVVMEATDTGRSLLHMWHLELSAEPVSSGKASTPEREQSGSAFSGFQTPGGSPPARPQRGGAGLCGLHGACRLALRSTRVYSQELELPAEVEVITVTPAAGHLSSSSLQPAGRAPYLLATSCSDGQVRFWKCGLASKQLPDCQTSPTPPSSSSPSYVWEQWPLLVEEGSANSSAISIRSRPIAASCCHTSRVAVAYRDTPTHPPEAEEDSGPLLVSVFQCESTGGSQWILEQTLQVECSTDASCERSPSTVVPKNGNDGVSEKKGRLSGRNVIHLDWVSREDGSHVLTVGVGSRLHMYGPLLVKPPELGLSDGGAGREGGAGASRLVLLRAVDLVSSVEGSPPFPVSLSWVRDGILVVGMECEMHVYSQWQPPTLPSSFAGAAKRAADAGSVSSLFAVAKHNSTTNSPSPSVSSSKPLTSGSLTSLAQKLTGNGNGKRGSPSLELPAQLEDSGLFEAAHQLSPTLPQYHPVQLLELMDLGRVQRVKAILSHLVKCVAGEVVVLKGEVSAGEGGEWSGSRQRSRTFSGGGNTSSSSPRDAKLFQQSGAAEIESIPPLPLYALLAADHDSTGGSSTSKDEAASAGPESSRGQTSSSQSDPSNSTYDQLFQSSGMPSTLDEPPDPFHDDEEDEDAEKAKVIDLSQYGPTAFGPDHAQVLSSYLLHSSLPGLTRMEQMSLMALADTVASTRTDIEESLGKGQGGETLDECGLRFLLAVRLHTFLQTSLPPAHRAQLLLQGLSTCHYAWAFHSEAEEELLNMVPALQKGDPAWPELRAMGLGWWLRSTTRLRRCIEKVAKAAYQRKNDPLDAALFYLAMKKKAVVWGLYRAQKNTKMTEFFSHTFTEDRWRRAALKNAYALLGKQRFQHAAAFFLLAGSLKDAVEVCIENLQDLQLALVISRLYESDFETSSTYKRILQRHVLGQDPQIPAHSDPFLRSMACWVLDRYPRALDTLLEPPKTTEDQAGFKEYTAPPGPVTESSCNPEVFNFYTFLRTHPLLLRRHLGSREKGSGRGKGGGLTAEGREEDSVTLVERRLFFTAAYSHLQAGCPLLALEVLSRLPNVIKTSSPHGADQDLDSPMSPKQNSSATEPDWSQPLFNGFGGSSSLCCDSPCSGSGVHSRSDSALSFDWSQPSASMVEEPLNLKWDSDKDEEEEEEEEGEGEDDKKPVEVDSKKINEVHDLSLNFPEPSSTSSPPQLSSEAVSSPIPRALAGEDILAAQLKFRACLKLLTSELRTLASGCPLEGARLRHLLALWLQREVEALYRCCGYSPCTSTITSTESSRGDASHLSLFNPVTEASSGEAEEASRVEAEAQGRRRWLQTNQQLLRIFLSYCSLHGSHGGGLASVHMELILLLQESQQDDEQCLAVIVPSPPAPAPAPAPATIPLLLSCMGGSRTVVANPLSHLTSLTHDILRTINALDSPPHPDSVSCKINVMHVLAASLSACIYQCLCDGHLHSQVNGLVGSLYQSAQPSNTLRRGVSSQETVIPNTPPAQWPGVAALVRLLSVCGGEEGRAGLGLLLCEVLTAVFLSLFVHGLATHSSAQLFRVLAHPLNGKMWVAVFGGGARLPVVTPDHPKVAVSQEDLDRKQKRFRLRSSRSGSREAPAESPPSPRSPPSESSPSSIIERFIPPELSIWDYFIAKPFLLPSESRLEYDSEESVESDEDEDEEDDGTDTFESGSSPLREHSNHNSYSWCLMRLAMVQMVLASLRSFYPMAGHDLMDLPVGSPLCHAVLKTLQRWEQVLLKRLEIFGGPPPKYISTHSHDDSATPGPALLRHKALFEPSNTPFRSQQHSALPVRRLWQYLVKQEEVQETFIRNIFTKKRDQNESFEDSRHNGTLSGTEESNLNQIEADLGYPGGKARIIHKESDIITAFAINKANRNCLVIASTHDIQELDVSSILATQILTWIDDEPEVETKGGDEFLVVHARDDFATLHGTTPYTHSSPGTPINLPWLGSMQTGRGAAVLIKRNINNVRRMASHPTLPYYLTGAQDGSVRMFEWGHQQQITCFRSPGNSRVTRIRFNYQGNKFGIVDADGALSLWQTNTTGNTPKPFLTLQCHNKTGHDFVFVGSSSLIATAGFSTDNRNVCLWDTLVTPAKSLVHAFCCHESGATVLAVAPKQQLLLAGGRRGYISVFDLTQRLHRQSFQAHDSPVKALAVEPTEGCFISGSAEGNIKVWNLPTQTLLHNFPSEHARQSIFRNLGTGVMQIEAAPSNQVFSCGADGTMKLRVLPDRLSVQASRARNNVKFII
ncbi:dmX-like protein 1 isoform X2 [Engraulis encrasicolus]|uniref:dmX-like protein 1 isoform X2 n=1 Tax=Engraulis encrasicolus TaxID=184585 RepID=UPI002FD5CD4D